MNQLRDHQHANDSNYIICTSVHDDVMNFFSAFPSALLPGRYAMFLFKTNLNGGKLKSESCPCALFIFF